MAIRSVNGSGVASWVEIQQLPNRSWPLSWTQSTLFGASLAQGMLCGAE